MNTIAAVDWIVLATFFVGMIVIGAFYARRQNTGGAFFGGDRSTPWWLSGVSYYMNSFSALAFVMYSAIAYKYGWVAATISWGSVVSSLVVMVVLAKKWRRVGAASPLDYLCERFGTRTNQAVTWLGVPMQVLDGAFKLLAIGTVAGLVMKTALPDAGADMIFSAAIAVSGAVIVAYTFLGGFRAALVCDFIQFFVILAIVLALPFFCLKQLAAVDGGAGISHGLSVLVERAPKGFFHPFAGTYDFCYLVFATLLGILSTGTSWSLIRRYSSLRSEKEVKKTGLLVAVLDLLSPPIFYFPAFAARVFMPDLDLNNSDAMNGVYAQVCLTVLPTGMVGLMLAAMFAATMSTLAGSYNAIANVLTTDVYQRLVNRAASARRLVTVGRILTLALGVLVIGLTLGLRFIQGAGDLMDLSNRVFALLLPPMSLTMVLGVLNRRMTKRSGMSALLTGIVAGLGVFVLSFCVGPMASWRETVPMTAITTAATLLGAIVGSFCFKDSAEERASVLAFFSRMKNPDDERKGAQA